VVKVLARHHEHGEHAVGPIDEGEAFLGLQGDRLDAGGFKHGPCRRRLPVVSQYLALADQGQSTVGQGCQVAAAPKRAVFADYRGDPRVQQRGQGLGDSRADAGAAPWPACAA
jgi:hypothetical protein